MYEYIYRSTCIGDNPKFLLSKFIPFFLSHAPFTDDWIHAIFLSYAPFTGIQFTTVLTSRAIPELICHYGCLAVFIFLCQFVGKVDSHI